MKPKVLNSYSSLSLTDDLTKSDSNDDESIESDISYTLYDQRYLILVSFSLLTFINGWMWIIWSPLTPDPLCEIWGVSSSSVDALSSLYMYPYMISSPLALFTLRHYGLRTGLIIGALLNFIGSLIRYSNVTDYNIVFVGTLFASIAQGFILPIPPLIASDWFGDSERTRATSIGILSNEAGVTFGLGATIFVNFKKLDATQKLENYVGIQMVISFVALVCILIYVTRDKPLTPPSAIAAYQNSSATYLSDEDEDEETETADLESQSSQSQQSSRSPNKSSSFDVDLSEGSPLLGKNLSTASQSSALYDFLEDFFAIFRSPSRAIFTFIYGATVGIYYFMTTFLNQLFAPIYSPSVTGGLGIILVLAGFVGSLWSASVIDNVLSANDSEDEDESKTLKKNIVHRFFSDENGPDIYWKMLMVLMGCSCINCAFLFVLLNYIESNEAYRILAILPFFLLISGIGFCLVGIISVGFEYGTALCFPANEAVVTGVMNCAAELVGSLMCFLGGTIMDASTTGNTKTLGYLIVSVLACSCLLMWKGVTEEPVRLIETDYDDQSESKLILK